MSSQILFECSNCGAQFMKWTGRCLECGKWGTLAEARAVSKKDAATAPAVPTKTVTLKEIQGKNVTRHTTTISEFDRVLGGGLVPGSLVLLGGEPGIGKSTLCLQLAAAVPHTLYLSAEESIEQIKLRADRLHTNALTLKLANETAVESIVATIKTEKPALVIIDSIQTISSDEASGEPGSPTQIRACTTKLLEVAKASSTAVVLVSHITKEGIITGPKTLEHLVDTVLYLEGERHHSYRVLRTVKNRFGSTDEVGIFEMNENGLAEIKNPSAAFMADRTEALPGNILTCLMEGTRPMLVEIQALVNKTVFGYPVRKASGFDLNRLHVLLAVLEKRAGLSLGQYDVHVNVVGGLTADEPAADLAVAMAVASAYKDKHLGNDLVVFGEVGLGGEVRPVVGTEKRIKECEQLGLKRAIVHMGKKNVLTAKKIKVIDVKNIQELIKHT